MKETHSAPFLFEITGNKLINTCHQHSGAHLLPHLYLCGLILMTSLILIISTKNLPAQAFGCRGDVMFKRFCFFLLHHGLMASLFKPEVTHLVRLCMSHL